MGVISARAHTARGIQGPVISAVCGNRSSPHVRDPNIGIFVVVTMDIGSSVNRVISPPLPPRPSPSLSVPQHPNTRIIPSSAHINWLGSREQVKSQLTDEPPVCISIAALHRDDIVASWHCFQASCHHPVIPSLGPACFYRSFNVFVFGTLTFMRFPSCRSKTKMHGTLKSAAPWFIMLSGPSPKDTEASATSSSKN